MNKLLIFISLILTISVSAQQKGKIEMDMNFDVKSLFTAFKYSIDTNNIEGYRIQIFYGSDMYEAKKVEAQVKQLFPETSSAVYRRYDQPAYKVRVGNFYREVDAQYFLMRIREKYPDAFLVKAKIDLPLLPMEEVEEEEY